MRTGGGARRGGAWVDADVAEACRAAGSAAEEARLGSVVTPGHVTVSCLRLQYTHPVTRAVYTMETYLFTHTHLLNKSLLQNTRAHTHTHTPK